VYILLHPNLKSKTITNYACGLFKMAKSLPPGSFFSVGGSSSGGHAHTSFEEKIQKHESITEIYHRMF
jgi:hypothetical protein